MSRNGMVMTQAADDDRHDFMREFGSEGSCSCFISPPCNSCTHPGNPRNQEEDDECWEPEDFSERIAFRIEKVRRDLHSKIDRMKGNSA